MERLRITQDGLVGLGTTTPNHRLSIADGPFWTGHSWIGAVDLPNASAIAWGTNNQGLSFGVGSTNSGFHIFHTTSAPGTTSSNPIYDLTIKSDGRVGIGTTEPQVSLHVKGSTLIKDGSLTVRDSNLYVDSGDINVFSGDIRLSSGNIFVGVQQMTVPDYVFEPDYPLLSRRVARLCRRGEAYAQRARCRADCARWAEHD